MRIHAARCEYEKCKKKDICKRQIEKNNTCNVIIEFKNICNESNNYQHMMEVDKETIVAEDNNKN
jgi:hypothetical protein